VNLAACGSLPTVSLSGTWYRAIPSAFNGFSLRAAHTTALKSRYSSGTLGGAGYQLLYLADDPMTALIETQALLGTPWSRSGVVANPFTYAATTPVSVTVSFASLIDLTTPTAWSSLATNAQELTGDWNGYTLRASGTCASGPVGIAPTQVLGRALFNVRGLEAFITYSARVPYRRALVVFPTKLGPSSVLTANDGDTLP
jgi:hypothetical protein